MEQHLVQIELFGTSFSIQTDQNEEYIQNLLAYIRKKANFVRETIGLKDPLRTSILTCLFLTEELFTARDSHITDNINREEQQEMDRITKSIIDRIEKTIQDTE